MDKIVLILLFASLISAQYEILTSVAGNGPSAIYGGFGGDGGPAAQALLNNPQGVFVDSQGNIFIADYANNRIRKVNYTTGIITTVAGNGTKGFGGDGGLATSAFLYNPGGVFVDSQGNIFIADSYNHRIRKVNYSTGIITTVAGNGTAEYGGDGGLATSANLNFPYGVFLDTQGNIFIADSLNNAIRKVNNSTGIITTVAGKGIAGRQGDGGLATSANLYYPTGVFVDSQGNIFIADNVNNRIRIVNNTNGIITTVVGNENQGYGGDGGLATNATLYKPYGVFVDSQGNIFIADSMNQRVRKVNYSTGIITTVAGNGTPGYGGDGGLAINANLNYPYGVFVDSQENIFIADVFNNRIQKVHNSSTILTTTMTAYSTTSMSSTVHWIENFVFVIVILIVSI